LIFQLLNNDSDDGTRLTIQPLSNEVDIDGSPGPIFPLTSERVSVASMPTMFAGTPTTDIEVEVSRASFDPATGRFAADLTLHNRGPSVGRNVWVAFPDLPAGVTLSNAQGQLADQSPYLSLRSAISTGGLGVNESSKSLRFQIDNPQSIPFRLTPRVYVGDANRPPQLDPIGPLAVAPGGVLEVALNANDADGDSVTYSLRAAAGLPNMRLTADHRLAITPAPDQLGSYTFEVVASDGAAEVSRTVSLEVIADPIATTRISGTVLDTDGTPLANVPLEVGRFQTMTAADGSFTLELPSFTVPTEPFDIAVLIGDPQFDPFAEGGKTIPLDRAGYDITTGVSVSNPRQFPNLVTAFIDASAVYGSNDARATALRTNDGTGKLKTSPGELLPLNDLATFPDGTLENENNSPRDPATLFAAGDVRANDNPALASLHTLLVREHNRRADELALADSNLTGEQLYQLSRRWVSAILQQITYNEFLPLLLGESALPAYSGYDETVDPAISALFSGAAFRFGHSLASSEMVLLDENNDPLAESPLSLRDAFFNPEPLKDHGIEPLLRGLTTQVVEELDAQVIDDLRNFLFGPPGAGGLDLTSLNIQRGRDLGL
ncbi:MAG: hypothetical protein KDA38_16325, partial [Planctomycetales bacterium]|nr:hypothetical protein [Planctomycetales bacterium]